MTKVRLSALWIISKEGGSVTARVFAERMWPGPFNSQVCRVGRIPTGTIVGSGCTQKAGAFLKAMNRSKLLSKRLNKDGIYVYTLAKKGAAALVPSVEVRNGITYRESRVYARRARETQERLNQ